MEVTRKEVVSPYAMFLDGKFLMATKHTVTSISDVRETAIGLVDFGHTVIGPSMSATEAEWRASAPVPSL